MPEAALAVLVRRPWLGAPLAWMAAARQVEPSSISRIARGLAAAERSSLALRLVAGSLIPFPADASLRRDRLRLLAALGRTRALDEVARALASDPALDGETAHLLCSLAARGDAALGRLAEHVRRRLTDDAPALERARFARRDDRAAQALRDYRAAISEARAGEADPILREAARAMLAEDEWPAAIDLIEEADRRALLRPDDPVRVHALAVAARRPRPLAPLPRLLFDDLAAIPAAAERPGPILMVGNSLRCGGMERVLAHTVAGLRARGHDVRLALSELPGEDEASRFFLPATGLRSSELLSLKPSGLPDPFVAAVPRRWRAEAAALHSHVRALRPRVVHAWNDRLGLIAALAALPAGVPRLVIHLHHMRPTRDPAEAAAAAAYPDCLRALAGRADTRLFFCAEAAARDYAAWLGLPSDDRFTFVRNGFPDEPPITPEERAAARRRFGLPAEAPVVASLFRFEPVKQPLIWLDAARLIADRVPQVHFLMPGDGELLSAVRARAAELGLGARVHLPGRIADPRAALAASDLLMMSSASEGLPNGAVEAQRAGVPVVGFDVGGTGETVRTGETGLLVRPGETAQLAEAAIAYLSDRRLLDRAGAAARAFAAEAFGMERYLDRIEAVYGAPQ